ncbi:hypothetical protein GQF42_04030 [Streptomyces broussonetiae]|uniref:Uncharacterized protein n=1 Tax=Streptomyces broussonetiae TaxID=2686304 RepID=A0A6I6MQ23_9ACTN|nr:hypothetical protein [Streptomyces broussonetiae]QHA02568.1 hypothetical protein GQF42_04030 [Streptomyces broussonetiae]
MPHRGRAPRRPTGRPADDRRQWAHVLGHRHAQRRSQSIFLRERRHARNRGERVVRRTGEFGSGVITYAPEGEIQPQVLGADTRDSPLEEPSPCRQQADRPGMVVQSA